MSLRLQWATRPGFESRPGSGPLQWRNGGLRGDRSHYCTNTVIKCYTSLGYKKKYCDGFSQFFFIQEFIKKETPGQADWSSAVEDQETSQVTTPHQQHDETDSSTHQTGTVPIFVVYKISLYGNNFILNNLNRIKTTFKFLTNKYFSHQYLISVQLVEDQEKVARKLQWSVDSKQVLMQGITNPVLCAVRK